VDRAPSDGAGLFNALDPVKMAGWQSGLMRWSRKPFSRKGGTGSNPVPAAESILVNKL
jgi:hypothetical protein